jgi:hypothetical protein
MSRFVLAALLAGFPGPVAQDPASPSPVRLLARVDDMGVAQAVNEACIRTYTDGIARSVEVIVPGPWFLDAVRRLKEHPGFDVGIHLCLTSEWENVKWRPLTHAPSLVDENGYFFPMTRQRKDFPPNTGFLEAKPRIEEVERELRAQIETIRRHLPRTSHYTAHMGTATSSPELRALVEKLGKEYGLAPETAGVKPLRGWSGAGKSAAEKESALVEAIGKLEPGTWMLVEHPGLDVAEMRAMGHAGYENVAQDRAGVTQALTSAAVRKAVQDRKIELVSYRDLRK